MSKSSWDNIPQEMKNIQQWIVWRSEETQNGKPTKVPYQVQTNKLADVTSPQHWGSFASAIQSDFNNYSGVGYCFNESDPYTGLDLDFSSDSIIIERQLKIFREMDSYSELSPSGKGLHIIVRGKVPHGRRRSNIEVYSSGRFFTMTGNIYHNKPIVEKQHALDILWAELGGTSQPVAYNGTFIEYHTDEQILAMGANASNGDKFKLLLQGEWKHNYPSQSEADFSFIDMLAFYTHNRNQIVRIFRNSILGRRDKANRADYIQFMLNKAFDRVLPPVDIEGAANAIEGLKADIAKRKATVDGLKAEIEVRANPYTIPPGLLGEIAKFIYASAPRQVPEIALAGAIGYMAGVVGRAYNVSGTGLNQYVLILAATGMGKEAMAQGIDKLRAAFKTSIPASRQFAGPADIASGQALLKYLSGTSPCFLSILGEFGLKLQQMASPQASSSETTLLRVLLDLYNKSGVGRSLDQMIYSQKENNTAVILSPAVSLLGETVPKRFYEIIDENMIASGLLPRFLRIEYEGKRPDLNEHFNSINPSFELIDSVGKLIVGTLQIMANDGAVVNVQITPEAKGMADDFERYATHQINMSNSEIISQLWNRAHIKLLKLAALVAVGCDMHMPTISVEHLNWSRGMIETDIQTLLHKFDLGLIGSNSSEAAQQREMVKAIKEYITNDGTIVEKYNLDRKMFQDRIVPYIYLNRRLIAMAAFRNDRMGGTNAIKRSLQMLIDTGAIGEVGRVDMMTKYGTSSRAYAINRLSSFI